MENHLKRPLDIFEVVHHKDGNKRNNNLRNLQIMTPEEHTSHHSGPRRKRTMSLNKVKEIIKLKNDGFNHTKISKIVGVSDTTVRSISIEHYNKEKDIYELWNLSKLGKQYKYTKEPKDKLSKKKVEMIIEFKNKGMNYSEIARRLEISNGTVRTYCMKNNL